MSAIRIPNEIWETVRFHLFGAPGEHFAFFLADWTYSRGEPVFLVCDLICIPDSDVSGNLTGMQMSLEALVRPINAAVRSNACLIEIHNHGGANPRFSETDVDNLPEFIRYVHSSLPGRPYAATVWGARNVYGEYFLPNGRAGVIDRVTIVGCRLRQVVSRNDDANAISSAFSRQLLWFTEHGQRELSRLRVAVVGCGGTGSHAIQNLAYIGCRDFVLIDDDHVEELNMNRLVTADAADIGTPKVIIGRRLIKSVAPEASVLIFESKLCEAQVLDAVKGADVLLSCVDNDGARLVLNEIALSYGIPLIDIAVGIEVENERLIAAGGRVAIFLPGGPCLHCMNQIDVTEANHFLLPLEEQEQNLARGYITGIDVPAPAVVSLNAQLVAAAINELAILVSGSRDVNPFLEIDLLGIGRGSKGQYMSPIVYKKDPNCVECTLAGLGDAAGIEERFGQQVIQR